MNQKPKKVTYLTKYQSVLTMSTVNTSCTNLPPLVPPVSDQEMNGTHNSLQPIFTLPSEVWWCGILQYSGREGCVSMRGTCTGFASFFLPEETKRLPLVSFDLFDHQIECLEWMRKRETESKGYQKGGIVSMEMGLGKTRVCLRLMTSSPGLKTLVVCPKGVLPEWKKEITKVFGSSVRPYLLHPQFTKGDTRSVEEILSSHSVFITTYETVNSSYKKSVPKGSDFHREMGPHPFIPDKMVLVRYLRQSVPVCSEGKDLLFSTLWGRVIFDEGHRLRNHRTLSFKTSLTLCSRYTWIISGTPVLNRSVDVWGQLFLCGLSSVENPKKWKPSLSHYDPSRWLFVKTVEEVSSSPTTSGSGRRFTIPKPVRSRVMLDFDPEERETYEVSLRRVREALVQYKGGNLPGIRVLSLLSSLRGLCVSPILGGKEMRELLEEGEEDYYSTKIRTILGSIVAESPTKRIVVFSFFSSVLRRMEKTTRETLGIPCGIIDGRVNKLSDRTEVIRDFSDDGPSRVLFCNSKSCGTGLNIPSGDVVFFVEPWWNSADENQCIGRVCRLGSTKRVKVYYFIYRDSIELQIRQMCVEKLRIFKSQMKERKRDRNGNLLPLENTTVSGMDVETLGRMMGLWGGTTEERRQEFNKE